METGMKILKALLVSGSLALVSASSANAAVLTFDDVVSPQLFSSIGTFSYGGLDFNHSNTGFVAVWDPNSPNSNGTNNLISGYDAILNITATGGGTFNLNSLDLAISWYDLNSTETIFVNGNPLVITQLLSNYVLNLVGVTSISITGFSSGYFLADNINVDISSVPVPAALPLLLTGLGGLVGVARSRKRKQKAA
jgi:hypothetical protein